MVRQPIAMLDRKLKTQGNWAAIQFLVQWEGQPIEVASWRNAKEIERNFPEFVNKVASVGVVLFTI